MREHGSTFGKIPAIAVLVLCACSASAGAPDGNGDRGPGDAAVGVVLAVAEVRAREIAFARTMADRDLQAFLSFVSPEAIFFNGDEPLRGRAAIEATWAPFFEGPDAPFSWHPDIIEVLESGGLAFSSGPVRTAAGAAAGRFNSVWRKEADGQWRVIFDKGS